MKDMFCYKSKLRWVRVTGMVALLSLRGTIIATFLLATPSVAEEGQCLHYDPEVVTLSGTLKKEVQPGPPNYTSVEQGDEPLPYWFLYLDKPFCVYPHKYEGFTEEGEQEVSKVQLVMSEESLYLRKRHLLGTKISAKGKLFHAITGRHYTAILISLETSDAIVPAKK